MIEVNSQHVWYTCRCWACKWYSFMGYKGCNIHSATESCCKIKWYSHTVYYTVINIHISLVWLRGGVRTIIGSLPFFRDWKKFIHIYWLVKKVLIYFLTSKILFKLNLFIMVIPETTYSMCKSLVAWTLEETKPLIRHETLWCRNI